MTNKKKLAPKLQAWIAARKQHHLSHAHVQMARELGLNPAKLGGIDNHKQEPWKLPLPKFIEHLYEKSFGKTRPEVVTTVENLAHASAAKDVARKAKKIARKQAAVEQPALQIDRAKLRDALRTISDDAVFYMLDEAIDLLPTDKLTKLVSQYIQLERVRPDAQANATKRTLLDDVKAFDAASRAGKYYESFDVDSKNYMNTSTGTRAFIAECERQVDRCVVESALGEPAETRAAFDTLFALLQHIDEAHDDIVFFADEGGVWQFGFDFRKVFKAWFICLSRCAEPEDFARSVIASVDALVRESRGTYLAAAKKIATPSQVKALTERAAKHRAKDRCPY
jgi:hypothetical protein